MSESQKHIEEILGEELGFLSKLSEEEQQKLETAILKKSLRPEAVYSSEKEDDEPQKIFQFSPKEIKLLLRALMLFPEDECNNFASRLLLSKGMEKYDQEFWQSFHIEEDARLEGQYNYALKTTEHSRSLKVDEWMRFPENFIYSVKRAGRNVIETPFTYNFSGLLRYVSQVPKDHPFLKEVQKIRSIEFAPFVREFLDLQGIQYLNKIERLDLSGYGISNVTPVLLLDQLDILQLTGSPTDIQPPRKNMRVRVEVKKYQEQIWKTLKNKEKPSNAEKHILGAALLRYPTGLLNKIHPDTLEYTKQIVTLLSSNDISNINMAMSLLDGLGDTSLFSDLLCDAGVVPLQRKKVNYDVVGQFFKKIPLEFRFYALYRLLAAIPEENRGEQWCKDFFLQKLKYKHSLSEYSASTLLEEVDWIQELSLSEYDISQPLRLPNLDSLKLGIYPPYSSGHRFSFSVIKELSSLQQLEIHFGYSAQPPIDIEELVAIKTLEEVRISTSFRDRAIHKKIAQVLSTMSVKKLVIDGVSGTPMAVLRYLEEQDN